MSSGLRHSASSSFFAIALFLGGCPKRQPSPRIVYVSPAPPPAATQSTAPVDSLTIEETPPPVATPPETKAETPPSPKPPHRPRRVIRTGPDSSESVPDEPPEEPPATVEIPALEPRETEEQGAAQRRQILALQKDVEQRLMQLARLTLGSAERKILDDARTFHSQSKRALEDGDLPRALNLARKAFLLVTALEREHQTQ